MTNIQGYVDRTVRLTLYYKTVQIASVVGILKAHKTGYTVIAKSSDYCSCRASQVTRVKVGTYWHGTSIHADVSL